MTTQPPADNSTTPLPSSSSEVWKGARHWLLRHWPGQPRDWLGPLAIVVITAVTEWRLMDSNLFAHLFDFGSEGLNSVQAWVNHGFWSMLGFFPWGKGYFPANVVPDQIYERKTPLHLFPLWGGYILFVSAGFPTLKLSIPWDWSVSMGFCLVGSFACAFPCWVPTGRARSQAHSCLCAPMPSRSAMKRCCASD